MSDLIYFPSFEPENEKWLKFSLLYLNEFRPIIPESGRDDISDTYKFIRDETDLINPLTPKYIYGESASIKSIEELEKILENPERYQTQFLNINKWKEENNWRYLIYSEKFSYVFEDFCIQNNLGIKRNKGLLVSESVGYIFMQNFANEISNQTNSSIITDSKKFEAYDSYKNIQNLEISSTHQLAESVINLKIPLNIKDIELSNIINFRNEHRELIKEFQDSLEKIEQKPNDISALKFIGEFDNIYNTSMQKIISISGGVIGTSFNIYSSLEDGILDFGELSSIGGELIATGYGIKEIIDETRNKRKCVKYFANLKILQ